MKEQVFQKQNLYSVEQSIKKANINQSLDSTDGLQELISPFILEVINKLYDAMNGHSIDISTIELPCIKELNTNNKSALYNVSQEKIDAAFRKFLSRLFDKDGWNNLELQIQSNIAEWLEVTLAKYLVRDERFSTTNSLEWILSKGEFMHYFFNSLIEHYPFEWVTKNNKEWLDFNISVDNLSTFMDSALREHFNIQHSFIEIEAGESAWEYIEKKKFNYGYIHLNYKYSFISSVLFKNSIQLWVDFIHLLKYPLIQDCAISYGFTPKDYIQILQAIVDKGINVKPHILLLLSKNYFDCTKRISENLNLYNDDSRRSERNSEIFTQGVEYNRNWYNEKGGLHNQFLTLLIQLIDSKSIEDWIFSYIYIENNNIHNNDLDLLVESYKSLRMVDEIDLSNFNLQKMNFYTQLIWCNENKDNAKIVLDAAIKYIKSENFHWNNTISDSQLTIMRGVAELIAMMPDPLAEAMNIYYRFKTYHQGWNTVSDYKLPIKESYILCVIILLVEYNDIFNDKNTREQFIEGIYTIIIEQLHYKSTIALDTYITPLSLIYLTTVQVVVTKSEWIEQKLINDCDSLRVLIAILALKNSSLEHSSKELLKSRLANELSIELKQMTQRKQHKEISQLEDKINVLQQEDIYTL